MKMWDISQMTSEALEDSIEILRAYKDTGVPDDFYDSEVELNFNPDSGMVFLTNCEYQVAVYNEDTNELESWYFTPYEGHEGTFSDLIDRFDEGVISSVEDLEYIRDLCEYNNEFEKMLEVETKIKKEQR